MKKKLIATGIAMMTIAISSCDEDTATMGYSLTSNADQFTIVSDTFNVSTRSILADSVLSRSQYSYLGRIKDPETGAYITSDFTTQFTVLEKESGVIFAPDSSIVSRDADGLVIADSCTLNIIIDGSQGDSLTAMKIAVKELDRPIEDNHLYYTSFDPEESGYVRTDGLVQNKLYSLKDLQLSDSMRYVRSTNSYYDYVSIPLNQPYTDKQGNSYNNYGTYLMRTYYAHPEYFRNSITFAHYVCPGFYVKTTDGLGLMVEVLNTQLEVNFQFRSDTVDYAGHKVFYGTEEALQTTHVSNDKGNIERLVNDNSCTYLKTPAGIFTEVTLPIEDIKRGHENDTITQAKIVFQRMLAGNQLSDNVLEEPQNLLMVERDSLYTFFENRNLTDNATSYLATYNSTYNTYSFNNIATLVNYMYDKRSSGSPNWNKVVLVPVQTGTTSLSSYSTSSTITAINNEMDVTSVRLVGGSANQHAPVTISVIYNQEK